MSKATHNSQFPATGQTPTLNRSRSAASAENKPVNARPKRKGKADSKDEAAADEVPNVNPEGNTAETSHGNTGNEGNEQPYDKGQCQMTELMNSCKNLWLEVDALKREVVELRLLPAEIKELRSKVAALEAKNNKLEAEATHTKKEAQKAHTEAAAAKEETATALKKYEMTANRLAYKIEADQAKARSKNVVIKNCKLKKTKGKPDEVAAEALACAKETLKELGCDGMGVLKATSQVVIHSRGTANQAETIVIATLPSEEDAARVAEASFVKWQQAIKDAGGNRAQAKQTPQVRRDLIKKAVAVMEAMKEQKKRWIADGTHAKVSYDIVDGMPRLRVKQRADGHWATWQTVEVGRDKFKFQPRDTGQRGGDQGRRDGQQT